MAPNDFSNGLLGSMATSATRVGVRAPVMEVFASIQGEGRYVGEPQTFLRLFGCPLRCRWCDTPASWSVGKRARVGAERRDGVWASPFQAATWIAAAEDGPRRTVSVTGGEPLVWPAFLLELRTLLAGRRLHLETAGAHPETLARVIDACDHVSLDLKLPADLDPPQELAEVSGGEPVPRSAREWATVRARVLALVRGRDACAKIVVAGGRSPDEFAALFDDVGACAPDLPVILQPVTPLGGVPAPTNDELRAVLGEALERGLDVRVLPQVHRHLGLP